MQKFRGGHKLVRFRSSFVLFFFCLEQCVPLRLPRSCFSSGNTERWCKISYEMPRTVWVRRTSSAGFEYEIFIISINGFYTSIVSRGDTIISKRKGFFEKEIKLYKIITKNIRIGSSSYFIFTVNILDNPLFIFFSIIKCIERKLQILCNPFCFFDICKSRARKRIFFIEIIDHKTTRNLISCFFEEVGWNRWINSAWKSYEYFLTWLIFRHPRRDYRLFLSNFSRDREVDA